MGRKPKTKTKTENEQEQKQENEEIKQPDSDSTTVPESDNDSRIVDDPIPVDTPEQKKRKIRKAASSVKSDDKEKPKTGTAQYSKKQLFEMWQQERAFREGIHISNALFLGLLNVVGDIADRTLKTGYKHVPSELKEETAESMTRVMALYSSAISPATMAWTMLAANVSALSLEAYRCKQPNSETKQPNIVKEKTSADYEDKLNIEPPMFPDESENNDLSIRSDGKLT